MLMHAAPEGKSHHAQEVHLRMVMRLSTSNLQKGNTSDNEWQSECQDSSTW